VSRRRRRAAYVAGGVRGGLAEHLRALLDGREHMAPVYGPLLAKLDAGEAVELSGWWIRRWVPGVEPFGRYRVDGGGAVTAVER